MGLSQIPSRAASRTRTETLVSGGVRFPGPSCGGQDLLWPLWPDVSLQHPCPGHSPPAGTRAGGGAAAPSLTHRHSPRFPSGQRQPLGRAGPCCP